MAANANPVIFSLINGLVSFVETFLCTVQVDTFTPQIGCGRAYEKVDTEREVPSQVKGWLMTGYLWYMIVQIWFFTEAAYQMSIVSYDVRWTYLTAMLGIIMAFQITSMAAKMAVLIKKKRWGYTTLRNFCCGWCYGTDDEAQMITIEGDFKVRYEQLVLGYRVLTGIGYAAQMAIVILLIVFVYTTPDPTYNESISVKFFVVAGAFLLVNLATAVFYTTPDWRGAITAKAAKEEVFAGTDKKGDPILAKGERKEEFYGKSLSKTNMVHRMSEFKPDYTRSESVHQQAYDYAKQVIEANQVTLRNQGITPKTLAVIEDLKGNYYLTDKHTAQTREYQLGLQDHVPSTLKDQHKSLGVAFGLEVQHRLVYSDKRMFNAVERENVFGAFRGYVLTCDTGMENNVVFCIIVYCAYVIMVGTVNALVVAFPTCLVPLMLTMYSDNTMFFEIWSLMTAFFWMNDAITSHIVSDQIYPLYEFGNDTTLYPGVVANPANETNPDVAPAFSSIIYLAAAIAITSFISNVVYWFRRGPNKFPTFTLKRS